MKRFVAAALALFFLNGESFGGHDEALRGFGFEPFFIGQAARDAVEASILSEKCLITEPAM